MKVSPLLLAREVRQHQPISPLARPVI